MNVSRPLSLPTLSKPIKQNKPALPPKFGGKTTALFNGPVKPRRLLEHLDFTAVGASPVKQIGLIFSSLIAWRLLAANDRRRASVSKRWNEMRENLMRDMLGFGFWFLGVPVLQRLYLGAVAAKKPELKDILIRNTKSEAQKPKNLLSWLKYHNPIINRYIPSSQQVRDWMTQAKNTLENANIKANHPAYREIEAKYQNLIKHRNFATAIGLGSTILLLGVVINLINFYLTRKNMNQELGGNATTTAPAASNPLAAPAPVFTPQTAFSSQMATSPFANVTQPFRPAFPTGQTAAFPAPYPLHIPQAPYSIRAY